MLFTQPSLSLTDTTIAFIKSLQFHQQKSYKFDIGSGIYTILLADCQIASRSIIKNVVD